MKNQEPAKLFKRKTSSMKLMRSDHKRNSSEFPETNTKFLSPKNIKGLDTSMYKKQQGIVKDLQGQVNVLREKIARLQREKSDLKDEIWTLKEDNAKLKQQIEEFNQRQKRTKSEHFATVDALTELKQRIDSLSDDQLSTVDDIDMEDVCHCHQYLSQITVFKDKVKFLEESLLHSQEIILKLQVEIKKVKISKQDRFLSQLEAYGRKGLKKVSVRQRGRPGSRMDCIEEIKEVNEE